MSIGIAYERHLKLIKNGYAFVSPEVPLHWTNHALVRVNSTDNKCPDVSRSPQFRSTLLNETAFPPRNPFSDFMSVFDFSGTDIIEYNKGEAKSTSA